MSTRTRQGDAKHLASVLWHLRYDGFTSGDRGQPHPSPAIRTQCSLRSPNRKKSREVKYGDLEALREVFLYQSFALETEHCGRRSG